MTHIWRLTVRLIGIPALALICLCAGQAASIGALACDRDGAMLCSAPGPDCDGQNPAGRPVGTEQAAREDGACTGFANESPAGFLRSGYALQGAASAVAWHGDYVYLAAAAVLQVYYAPPGATPTLVRELELRDWVREMAVDGDTLFLAARGDGLYALDLSADPANPAIAGRVEGVFDAGGYSGVKATFNGLDARNGRVAVARANFVAQSQGGVDALVYDYDPSADAFTLVRVIGTEARGRTAAEVPITAGLTEDGTGLYLGYGAPAGELVYVPIDSPADPFLRLELGAAMDIKVKDDVAFVAVSRIDWPWVTVSMLSRVQIVGGALVENRMLTNLGSSAGGSVEIDGDLLCFGTLTPARYEGDRYNLWAFTNLLEPAPVRVGAGSTPDWIYQLACRETDANSGWVYAADEWGGLELWQRNAYSLTLDLNRDRVATGALSLGMWNDGATVYSIKEGAGLWSFEESDPEGGRPIVEWIDLADPGCQCAGCCPPAQGTRPYPPAVFVSAGTSSQGQVVVLAEDRNTAVGGQAYLMFFEQEAGGHYVNVHSHAAADWSGDVVKSALGEILFTSTATRTLEIYQHCPEALDPVRLLAGVPMPGTGNNMSITDASVYGDYLFVTEVHKPFLSDPDSGAVHVYRWKQGALATCPQQPTLPDPPVYLGSFGGDYIPHRLLLDAGSQRLFVGCASRTTFPPLDGALWMYDLTAFDPGNPGDLDNHRTDISPDGAMRATRTNVHGLLLEGDNLFVADADNGLYKYSFAAGGYVGFYPAHRGPIAQPYVPQLVQSPPGVVPLFRPIALVRAPSGRLLVQEYTTGRVAFFVEEQARLYLPVTRR